MTGQNLLLTALRYGCTSEFVDYLVELNISATEYDLRRYHLSVLHKNCIDWDRSWNILHIAADRNDEQLSYLLEKLPRDDLDSMLVQQSKPYLNTVSHYATLNLARCLTLFLASSHRRVKT